MSPTDSAPADPSPRPRRPRRAVRPGIETGAVPGASRDERPQGWGERGSEGGSADSNDERLRRDVPPHY